jgi:hypothetical protein
MSRQMTSKAIRNVISSLESASGATRLGLQGGQIADPSGLAPARANLSPRRAKEQGLLTSGTFGRIGTISSESAALSASLASRLRTAVDCLGSTLFKMTWKTVVTPAGRSISRLVASAPRTSVCDSGSPPLVSAWPTPCAQDGPNGGPGQGVDRLPGAAAVTARILR